MRDVVQEATTRQKCSSVFQDHNGWHGLRLDEYEMTVLATCTALVDGRYFSLRETHIWRQTGTQAVSQAHDTSSALFTDTREHPTSGLSLL